MSEKHIIKKTLGKNGKYYHYESLSPVDSVKDVYWYKISQDYYAFLLKDYQKDATEVVRNESGDIVYMEYVPKDSIVSNPDFIDVKRVPENAGCVVLVISFFTTLTLFGCITMFSIVEPFH